MTLLRVAAYEADESGFVASCPRAHEATESGFTLTATQAVKGTNGALQQLSCLSDPCQFPFLRQPSRYRTAIEGHTNRFLNFQDTSPGDELLHLASAPDAV